MNRLEDVRLGVEGVDESESVVVEVSGEEGGVDNVVWALGAALERVFDGGSFSELMLAGGESLSRIV